MVMVTVKSNGKEHTYYMDKKLKRDLDILLDACTQDDDFFIVFSGEEGAGKSVFMQQVGTYCADYLGTDYNINNIVFSLNDYLRLSLKSPHYTVVNLDESRKILNRSAGATKVSRTFTDYVSECRSKRQIHIIGVPAYHDLNPYIVNWRMKLLIQVLKTFKEDKSTKSGYSLSRGTFKAYVNKDDINKYYEYKYKYPRKWECFGKFPNYKVIDDTEYNKKKDTNMEDKYDPDKPEEKKEKNIWQENFVRLAKLVNEKYNYKYPQMSSDLNHNKKYVTNLVCQYEENLINTIERNTSITNR